jgi:hypothetical protein
MLPAGNPSTNHPATALPDPAQGFVVVVVEVDDVVDVG